MLISSRTVKCTNKNKSNTKIFSCRFVARNRNSRVDSPMERPITKAQTWNFSIMRIHILKKEMLSKRLFWLHICFQAYTYQLNVLSIKSNWSTPCNLRTTMSLFLCFTGHFIKISINTCKYFRCVFKININYNSNIQYL